MVGAVRGSMRVHRHTTDRVTNGRGTGIRLSAATTGVPRRFGLTRVWMMMDGHGCVLVIQASPRNVGVDIMSRSRGNL